jgi:hypothetical protein
MRLACWRVARYFCLTFAGSFVSINESKHLVVENLAAVFLRSDGAMRCRLSAECQAKDKLMYPACPHGSMECCVGKRGNRRAEVAEVVTQHSAGTRRRRAAGLKPEQAAGSNTGETGETCKLSCVVDLAD